MHLLDGVDLYRLTSLPRPLGDGTSDPTPMQLLAALTATHATLISDPAAETAAFVAAWVRPSRDSLHVLVGGRPVFPPSETESAKSNVDAPVLFPAGARGHRLATGLGSDMLDGFDAWVPCLGQPDGLRVPRSQERRDRTLRGSFDDYAAHLGSPFAWVVFAEPVPRAAATQVLAELAARIPRLRQRANSEPDRIDLARSEERYRELSRSLPVGLWNVRILVGAPDTGRALAAAALLGSATDLDDRQYVLTPGMPVRSISAAAAPVPATADGGPSSPFLASADLLATVARPPAQELPGVELIAPHTFDVTVATVGDDGIPVGTVLDRAYLPAGELVVARETLNRHAFVCGATGSGKSQTMRTLLEALSRHPDPVPWLVVEPVKAEYAAMAGRLAGHDRVAVIRPGDPDVAPASLNPLEPEPGFPLQSHADLVRALFLAAFDADEPFPQVLSQALTDVYISAGWDMVSGRPRLEHKPVLHRDETAQPASTRYPTLGELQATARRVVDAIGYAPDITSNVRGFVDVRIGSLRSGTPGRFFEGGHPLDVAALLAGNVVLELDSITNDQDKAFLIGAVLIRIVEHLRVRQHERPAGVLRHVLVIEEAHRLLKRGATGPAAAAVELFASLLAEIRAYGEGVIVVEQIPSKIVPDVIKNTALKIMHRLPARDDREAVGSTINLQPGQSELVVSLRPGRAAVATDGMDRPVLVQFPDREATESTTGLNLVPPLSGIRSPLCPSDCARQPCTLMALVDASDLATRPRLVVWVEAMATALITGQTPPGPAPELRAELLTTTKRLRECALAHATERATAARGPRLRCWVDLTDFATQLQTTATDLLEGRDPDLGDRRRWTAEYFRWQDILFELQDAVGEQGVDAPVHPDTQSWADLGLRLYGRSLGEQLAELLAHPTFRPGADRVCVGDVQASLLTRAIDELTGATGSDAVAAALHLSCVGEDINHITGQIEDLIWPMTEGT